MPYMAERQVRVVYLHQLMSTKTQIAIVDSHAVMRHGLSAILKQHHDLEVVFEADTAEAALAELGLRQIDLIIIDLQLPEAGSVALVSQVRRYYPDIRVLMMSAVEESASVAMAHKTGAQGLLIKRRAEDDVKTAIDQLMRGGTFWQESDSLRDENSLITTMQPPSPRELQVLRLVGAGHTSKEIARELEVSVRTIDVHRANLKRKLRVKSTSELVKYAVVLTAMGQD
jgi:two-component system, NarL family, response regulator NreC